jgi:polysaccharide deacetylase 2 family uncharacterized protein YibQ
MDDKLKKALDFSNYVIALNNHKRILSEKYQESVVMYYNGGKFTVNQTLISFCKTLNDLHQEGTILVDDDTIPIEISNIKDFMSRALNEYVSATNTYLVEYRKLLKNRSVAGIVDL